MFWEFLWNHYPENGLKNHSKPFSPSLFKFSLATLRHPLHVRSALKRKNVTVLPECSWLITTFSSRNSLCAHGSLVLLVQQSAYLSQRKKAPKHKPREVLQNQLNFLLENQESRESRVVLSLGRHFILCRGQMDLCNLTSTALLQY